MLNLQSDLPLDQIKRFQRQIIVDGVNIDGQKLLINSKICIVGLGGLGSPVLAYLCNTGISNIGIVDFDIVETSNLQRQIIHNNISAINKISKTESAYNFIKAINPSINIKQFNEKMDSKNIDKILSNFDLIIDCCDNIELRYLINDYCVKNNKSFVSASVLKWEGQIFVYPSNNKSNTNNRCFRCMFPNPKTTAASCDQSGVIGSMCGVIGSMQATEVIKLILNNINNSKFIIFDGKLNRYKEFTNNSKKCNICLNLNETDAITNIEEKFSTNIICIDTCINANNIKLDNLNITFEEISKISNYTIYDIRSTCHYRMLRIENSINISIEELLNKNFNKNDNILILCYKGISSRNIVSKLREKGINSYSIYGGIEEFKRIHKF